ncbi:Hcp1 family type VI secretion system effector [Acidobacteria bacterium Mor1]|nr:Hcp1 family type VI secretion system effector [Acidobacteria bacterium Mor1]
MAVDMFLKLGDIKGESRDKSHKDEIDLLAWSWGMSQSGTMHSGGGGGAGKVSIQDIACTKWVDKSSANLLSACSTGKHYPEAVLTVRKAGENPIEYIKVTMANVLVSSVQAAGGGGDDKVSETVTLNFEKVKMEYAPQKDDGSADAAVTYGWNISENSAW